MDSTVEQQDGYHFVYTLPLDERRLLIEDTYFSDDATLPIERIRSRIRRYAASCGWNIVAVTHEESGVLPMALGGNAGDLWSAAPPGVTLSGLSAGLFHPATGYSFPDAVRTADLIAHLPDLVGPSIHQAQRSHSLDVWRQRGFYRYLNSLLFHGAPSAQRYRVLERFYGLHPALIQRFYAGRSTVADRMRILCGKPPISIGRVTVITARIFAAKIARRAGRR